MRKIHSFKFFSHTNSIEQKCKRASLVLHCFVRHKYLREDHSLAKSVVSQLRIQSYSGERAVSFKKVSLPELLLVAPKATMASQVPCLIKILP